MQKAQAWHFFRYFDYHCNEDIDVIVKRVVRLQVVGSESFWKATKYFSKFGNEKDSCDKKSSLIFVIVLNLWWWSRYLNNYLLLFKNTEVKFLTSKISLYLIGNSCLLPKNPKINWFCNFGMWHTDQLIRWSRFNRKNIYHFSWSERIRDNLRKTFQFNSKNKFLQKFSHADMGKILGLAKVNRHKVKQWVEFG